MMLILLSGMIIGYIVFILFNIGLPQRLFLALGPISLEKIPDQAARRYGDKVLFTTDSPCRWEVPDLRDLYEDQTSWSALRIKSTAGYLAKMLQDICGLEYGDRVAIFKKNHFDIHIFTCSVVRAGGIACPINGKFLSDKLHPYLINIDANLLISDSQSVCRVLGDGGDFGDIRKLILTDRKSALTESDITKLDELLVSAHPGLDILWLEETLAEVHEECETVPRGKDEPLYLVHSSGTTGFPKAVILKNGPQSHAVRGWLCYVHLSRRGNKGYMAVPNNHQAVILSFNSLLLWGFPAHWIGPYDRDEFDAYNVVRELSDYGFTGFFGFPVTYTQLKEIPLDTFDLKSMKFWASTADASHEAVIRPFVKTGRFFKSFGLPVRGSIFLDAQGSSEVGTPSVLRYITPFTNKFGRRIGRPGSTPFGPRIRVVKYMDHNVYPAETGRLEVKGKTIFAGYWNNHKLTFKAFRDGWFYTGDIVQRGNDGQLVQLDREVDVIRTKSGDVYSLPMEEKLHKHRAVFDVCVYGERQPDGWQLPAAAVALKNGFEIDTGHLKSELNAELNEEEQLKTLQLMDWNQFPMGVTGKTLKRVFREQSEPGKVLEQNRPIVFRHIK